VVVLVVVVVVVVVVIVVVVVVVEIAAAAVVVDYRANLIDITYVHGVLVCSFWTVYGEFCWGYVGNDEWSGGDVCGGES